jgi:membrane dipeptidase
MCVHLCLRSSPQIRTRAPVDHAMSALFDEALVWDQHGCLPLRPEESAVEELALYPESGVDFVSINVGMDSTPPPDALKILLAFRRGVLQREDRFTLVQLASDVARAKATGRLAIAFDLEGTEPLDGNLDVIQTYYELGVHTMLIAYNEPNRAGGGCHGDPETGLTTFGKAVVKEMNRVGMLVDATHCSRRTTFDLFESSSAPVIFSHSVPAGVKKHPRNIDDEQIRACARTGGVIGINGVGIFLGSNDSSSEAVVRAIDYAVQLVGPEHVGLGLDFVFDRAELDAFIAANATTFPSGYGYTENGPVQFASPAQLSGVTSALAELGYSSDAIKGILGGNFFRVASQVWR